MTNASDGSVPFQLLPASAPDAQDGGALPDGWEAVCPNAALAPRFAWVVQADGRGALHAQGNGRRECFGYLRRSLELASGQTYRLRVRLRFAGFADVNHHLVHGVFGPFNAGVFGYRCVGDEVVGEAVFAAGANTEGAELRLYLRYAPEGQVWWREVSLTPCPPIAPRPLTVACAWGPGDLPYWAGWLDRAGERGADLALLPEMLNGRPVAQPEPLDGPSGNLLAEKAGRWGMYVSGSFYERRGDMTLNTAPLYDRQGQLVGSYSKNQLYDPEADEGCTPGVGLPVFTTDWGRLGIIICYDSWFPETTRLLAYQGAEVVLFPNAGYFAGLMPARAADNGVWLVVSSLNGPAGVWDPSGARAGEQLADPTRYAEPAVTAYTCDETNRLVLATLDLSRPQSPHWWGGPMRSAPGARRVRQTLIDPLEEEIARQVRRWHD